MNLGTVPARSKVTLEYDVVVDSGVESVPAPGPTASFSSREIGVPVKANTSEPLALPSWRARSARSQVLPSRATVVRGSRPGSLSAGAKRPPEAVRVFGLDSRYLEETPPSALSTDRTNPALDYSVPRRHWRCQSVPVLWCRYGFRAEVSPLASALAASPTCRRRSLSSTAGRKAARAVRLRPELGDRRPRPVRQNDHPGLPERDDDPRHGPPSSTDRRSRRLC